jgi:GTP-binding protein HflX
VAEIKAAVARTGADTVVFDDELSPGQLRNLERALGGEARLCDRTALILDIFSQRAATREGKLQVELAQTEYQLPRLTKMWSHLERQAGGSGGGRTKGECLLRAAAFMWCRCRCGLWQCFLVVGGGPGCLI